MDSIIKEEIKRMGKGWFVLRLYNELVSQDYDVNKDYEQSSIKTKEESFRRVLKDSKQIIKEIVSENSNTIRHDTLGLNSDYINDVAKSLYSKLVVMKPSHLKLKTKSCKGIAPGDASNAMIRAILVSLSSKYSHLITDDELFLTEEYFDWKDPYTGQDIKAFILGDKSGVQVDHITPQNKEYCGLNVMGNLVYTTKKTNLAKRGMTAEEFLLTDTKVLGSLDIDERKARLKKIEDFQKKYGYDNTKIKTAISPELNRIYKKTSSDVDDHATLLMKKL